jgi:hypothetical protein
MDINRLGVLASDAEAVCFSGFEPEIFFQMESYGIRLGITEAPRRKPSLRHGLISIEKQVIKMSDREFHGNPEFHFGLRRPDDLNIPLGDILAAIILHSRRFSGGTGRQKGQQDQSSRTFQGFHDPPPFFPENAETDIIIAQGVSMSSLDPDSVTGLNERDRADIKT